MKSSDTWASIKYCMKTQTFFASLWGLREKPSGAISPYIIESIRHEKGCSNPRDAMIFAMNVWGDSVQIDVSQYPDIDLGKLDVFSFTLVKRKADNSIEMECTNKDFSLEHAMFLIDVGVFTIDSSSGNSPDLEHIYTHYTRCGMRKAA